MTIKLVGSTNGSTSLDAPASTTGGADLSFTLPNATTGGIERTKTTPGAILQVVQGVKTNTFSTTSAAETAFVDTGLSASITPSSSSNKVLICWNMGIGSSGDNVTYMKLQRGSTDIFLGDADSSRVRTTQAKGGPGGGWQIWYTSGQYLDSPSTTSATTYKWVWASNGAATSYMNRSHRDHTSTNDEDARCASSITLMEVAG